jgi:beta-lactamase regulating signal transducer with metallopeptidase domain
MTPFADVLRALAHGLFDVAALSVVLACVAFTVGRFGGIDAATRSRCWSVVTIVPLLAFAAALIQPALAPVQDVSARVSAGATATLVDPLDMVLRAGDREIATPAALAASTAVPPTTTSLAARVSWLALALALWFSVAAYRIAAILRAVVRAHRLASTARPSPALEIAADADESRVALCVRDDIDTAVAVGLTRRLVILPSRSIAELPPAELRAVVLHEIAHLSRRDDWVYLAERLACAILWFDPIVHLACGFSATWREIACDAAAARGAGGRTCATALWRSASALTAGSSQVGLALLSGGSLVRRVEALLAPVATSRRSAAAAMLALTLAASAASAVVVVRAPAYGWPGARGLAATGSMHERRASFAAVKLRDGRVLVAGGLRANHDFITEAELYDPARGVFEPTGSMLEARTGLTGTLLPDGRVLVAGGWTMHGIVATTELYDPATGRFGPGPPMHSVRAGQTATLLRDGTVLLAGGEIDNLTSTASAELYDPRRGAFVDVGTMNEPRASHTATLLSDGRLLITGGGESTASLRSSEIYDSVTRRFTEGPQMSTPRSKHGAALLADGSVLVVGGGADNGWSSRLATSERYDPRTNTFVPAGTMQERRFKLGNATVRLSNGDVLVAGGSTHVELYDAAAGSFRAIGAPMDNARNLGAAVLLDDGSVLISGGYASVNPLPTTDTALRYR